MQHAAHYSLLFILLVFLLMSLFVPKKNDIMGTDKKKLLELHWLADLTKQFAP